MTAPVIEIEWDGRVYDWRIDGAGTANGIMIEEYTKVKGMIGYEDGIRDCEVRCMQALLWDMRRQAGESSPPMRTLDFSVADLWAAWLAGTTKAFAAKVEEDAAAGIDEDPTGTPEPSERPERTPVTPAA